MSWSDLSLAPGGAIGQPLDPVAAPSAQSDDHEVVQQLAHLRYVCICIYVHMYGGHAGLWRTRLSS